VRELPRRSKQQLHRSGVNNLNRTTTSYFDTEAVESDSSDEENSPFLATITLKCPRLALVNGNFRGQTPTQLSILNRTELSMVSLINCVYTLCILKPNSNVPAHYGTTGTVFSILNDLHSVASVLPRLLSINDVAFMRSADSQSNVEFQYSPQLVLNALEWLAENNELYKNKFVQPVGDEWARGGQDTAIPMAFIPLTPADLEGLSATPSPAMSDGHAANPSAPESGIADVLLIPTEDNRDLRTQISRILESNNTR
jgi:hypothetical protein